jgi:hypothetical protein
MFAHGISIAMLFGLADRIERSTGTLDFSDLGGLESLNAVSHGIETIINSEQWQAVWQPYWNEKKLITCARVCGVNKLSKPNDQFIKRISN